MDDKPPNRAATAGYLLVSAIVLCAAIGLGIGSLVGAQALLAILGVFVGLGVGFALVYQRFSDL
jgi:F0F1-type ATP synthase assembly protein I